MATEWAQKKVSIQAKPRGCHVITAELYKQVPELHEFEMGLANIWSASLSLSAATDATSPCNQTPLCVGGSLSPPSAQFFDVPQRRSDW